MCYILRYKLLLMYIEIGKYYNVKCLEYGVIWLLACESCPSSHFLLEMSLEPKTKGRFSSGKTFVASTIHAWFKQ